MVAAMAGFAAEDVFLKRAARLLPLGEVLLITGALGTAVFAALARAQGASALPRALLRPGLLVRAGFELQGRLFYALAVALTPISTAAAILQATPLLVVGGAAVIFGEKIGWRRWLAVVAGFGGVLLILRPGWAGFDALSLLALAGMLGFAGRDLATRAAPLTLSNAQLGVAGFAVLTLSGALILTVTGGTVWPPGRAILLTLASTGFAIAAYAALTGAMRSGEVAVVTPFRFTRLIFALILGIAVFDERPDALTLIGAAVIVGAGVYTLTGQRRT